MLRGCPSTLPSGSSWHAIRADAGATILGAGWSAETRDAVVAGSESGWQAALGDNESAAGGEDFNGLGKKAYVWRAASHESSSEPISFGTDRARQRAPARRGEGGGIWMNVFFWQ